MRVNVMSIIEQQVTCQKELKQLCIPIEAVHFERTDKTTPQQQYLTQRSYTGVSQQKLCIFKKNLFTYNQAYPRKKIK